ncbi:TubF protein [Streptomyces lincolnensis]|uniref:TubF protein n=1 Tax=Streptomyces lincolnensis TaxID=1915 RepID=A0A1B1MHV7_STRLN|nr:type I polyketide synthase [Streptomyces lincolnensis]ANS68117.1 TubF protein [Streptomyces lincolnensis]AXG53677.1 TubF protein [Streptomyces lincolnensis]QMV09764.1 type I polyketide synthase [Streptomyces lincolnensis]
MREAETEPIAVVGVYARTPGTGDDLDAFWDAVTEGRDAVTTFPDTGSGTGTGPDGGPDRVPRRGVLADVGLFDAEAFQMPPREAELTDPQHRLLLEAAWVLLERAGYGTGGDRATGRDGGGRPGGRVGVFAGAGLDYYLLRHILADPSIEAVEGLLPIVLANDKDHLAAKIAYRLGLTGPAMTVQTACSTSLVAVHQGVRALRCGDADVVLAGGVTVELPQDEGYSLTPGSVLSRSGRCRPFLAGRDGSVPANGLGMVALRRLSDALADHDTVLAVIRGSAMNNDGGDKAGYTAPGFAGQVDVVRAAHRDAGIDPGTIGYLEGHGTGTEVGDDIELAALSEVFARGRADEPLPLGSAKATFGNLGAAAGVVGLVKTVLALRHRTLPPLPGAGEETATDDLPDGFVLDPVARPWAVVPGVPRRAGISSYGMGGTNCHVVVEEFHTAAPEPAEDLAAAVIPLSATGPESVLRYRDALVEHLAARPGRVGEVARTFVTGRRVLPVRLSLVLTPDGPVPDSLQDAPRRVARKAPAVVFAFGDERDPAPGALADLYARHAVVRDRVEEILAPLGEEGTRIRAALLEETPSAELAPVRLYVIQVATAELLRSLGVEPVAVLGHGPGEFAAACVAGEFSAADGVGLLRSTTGEAAVTAAVKPPSLAVVSTRTGRAVDPRTGRDAPWWQDRQRPEHVPDAVRTLAATVPGALVVDIGPGRSLTDLLSPYAGDGGPSDVVPVLPGPGAVPFLTQLGRLWSAGVGVDLGAANGADGYRRVPLPTYPFDRRPHWIDAAREKGTADESAAPTDPAGGEETLSRVLRIWEEILGLTDIEPDADLYMLGGDSFTLVRLAGRLSRSCGPEITATDLFGVDLTPRAMAGLIDELATAPRKEAR